jgi:hypothetical protein
VQVQVQGLGLGLGLVQGRQALQGCLGPPVRLPPLPLLSSLGVAPSAVAWRWVAAVGCVRVAWRGVVEGVYALSGAFPPLYCGWVQPCCGSTSD